MPLAAAGDDSGPSLESEFERHAGLLDGGGILARPLRTDNLVIPVLCPADRAGGLKLGWV
jgi:hypothetical protein